MYKTHYRTSLLQRITTEKVSIVTLFISNPNMAFSLIVAVGSANNEVTIASSSVEACTVLLGPRAGVDNPQESGSYIAAVAGFSHPPNALSSCMRIAGIAELGNSVVATDAACCRSETVQVMVAGDEA
jgi:hypothetical protein